MYTVTREMLFCYGHRLLNYEGKCRHLHGHNGRVEIVLSSATLDDKAMVRDFEEIKRIVQGWINDTLDHKMILCKDDPMIPVLKKMKEPHTLVDANPTAEVLAKLIFDYAESQALPVVEVRFWESPKSSAAYRASP